jgi:O-antigen ligase
VNRFALALFFTCLCILSLTTWCEGPWAVAALNLAIFPISVLVVRSMANSTWSRSSRPEIAIQWILLGAVGLAMLQVMLRMTVYTQATIAAATYWSAAAGTFWISGRAFFDSRRSSRWLEYLLYFAVAITILCLLQRFSSGGRFLWIFDSGYLDIYGPFASYMDFAAFLELIFPYAIMQAFSERKGRKTMYACAAAMMFSAVVMSGSRAGSVLLGLEFVAVSAFMAVRNSGSRRRMIYGAMLAIAVTGVLCVAAGLNQLWNRMREHDPYAFRRNVALSAAAMIGERPWSGFGLGNFATAYPAYARFDDGTRVNHAHNEWAEWAVEGGLPLAIAMLAVAVVSIGPAARTVWGLGIISVFLHCLVDYPLRRFGVAGWFFFMLAGLHASDWNARSFRRARVQPA